MNRELYITGITYNYLSRDGIKNIAIQKLMQIEKILSHEKDLVNHSTTNLFIIFNPPLK